MRLFPSLGALALAAPLLAQHETAASGFELTPLHSFGLQPTGASATLANGDVIVFDGSSIDRHAADGTPLVHLGTIPGGPHFPGCLAVDPTESFAVLGESSVGDVFRVDLSGAGTTFVANLFFNFDAAFEPGGQVIVSAATCGGFGCGNDLVRLDPASGATTTLAHVAGPSGPIAIDAAGNLFYATQSPTFPAPPGATNVVGYVAAQLASGALLGDADLFTLATGFDGGSSLAVDPSSGVLYLAENNFGTGLSRIVEVGVNPGVSPVVVAGPPFAWIDRLRFFPGGGPAVFAPYQPAAGGSIVYRSSDFAAYDDRTAVRPARATALVTGPGTVGPGAVTLSIDGAEPGGLALVFYGPSALYTSAEAVHAAAGSPPLFSGLDPFTLATLPFLLGVDAQGHASLSAANPGGLEGTLVFQGLLLGAGPKLLGTTTAAFL